MVSEVRSAVRSLGTATVTDILVETGFDRWQVEAALETLVRRGDVCRVPDATGLASTIGKAGPCRICPMAERCAMPRGRTTGGESSQRGSSTTLFVAITS